MALKHTDRFRELAWRKKRDRRVCIQTMRFPEDSSSGADNNEATRSNRIATTQPEQSPPRENAKP
jgi:hypothetical protein